jgi:hypothetical protein
LDFNARIASLARTNVAKGFSLDPGFASSPEGAMWKSTARTFELANNVSKTVIDFITSPRR